MWNCLPTEELSARELTTAVDTGRLLPVERGYYEYKGSLTTPPCTEGVLWLVLHTPVTLSRAQIEEFRAIIHGNNRPVQPLNGRQISRSR